MRLDPHRPHEIGGDGGEIGLLQRGFQHAEIDDQLVGIGVGRLDRGEIPSLRLRDGAVELAQHAGEILAVGLARIARGDGGAHAARLKFTLKRLAEAFRHGHGALGDRQKPREIGHPRAVAAQSGQRILAQGPGGHGGGDGRVAVAVAADP